MKENSLVHTGLSSFVFFLRWLLEAPLSVDSSLRSPVSLCPLLVGRVLPLLLLLLPSHPPYTYNTHRK